MCLYRLATEKEKQEILSNLPPLIRGWKAVYPAAPLLKTNHWATWGIGIPIREGWYYGNPHKYTKTTLDEVYYPYVHVFLSRPTGVWKVNKWRLLPVHFWKEDIVHIGYQAGEDAPVAIVKKVNYPDPEKYFSLLKED